MTDSLNPPLTLAVPGHDPAHVPLDAALLDRLGPDRAEQARRALDEVSHIHAGRPREEIAVVLRARFERMGCGLSDEELAPYVEAVTREDLLDLDEDAPDQLPSYPD